MYIYTFATMIWVLFITLQITIDTKNVTKQSLRFSYVKAKVMCTTASEHGIVQRLSCSMLMQTSALTVITNLKT